ncbi:extracellular solute-binding protein [Desulfobulbus alkaliphilus]|uniref:extracellular solute-binding protein n=1 Tax=Desulfobulbus alkaliphilus TaxID=869814 RepID=UPI001965C614|nr:extracellular solute-binding protein [Desulfobulbus alkaliphilus]MBM9536433.1 ABC transporter substrate-binding protein [Desulfobulbus alkaliphilus]
MRIPLAPLLSGACSPIFTGALFFFFIFLCCLLPTRSMAAHGVSIDGNLKYPEDFSRFAYTSDKAVRGGTLILHDLGSFEKMNPFTLRGSAPRGLGSYVFETLAVPSLDEPFAYYGLIAEEINLAEDRKSVTYTINPRARFSDGRPVTAEDVKFSLEILKSDQAHPFYQMYFRDIEGADVLDDLTIRFRFARENRELHIIAGQLPVLSKTFYTQYDFNPSEGGDAMVIPVGSGPYVVAEVLPGRSITYRKNPEYWAVDHPTRRGMFNFERIMVKYFRDPVVSVEAFKAGEFDFLAVNVAKQWERDLSGRHFDSGQLIKKTFPHRNNAGMQGFVFNTRKPFFEDRQVRKALGLAFDFEWTNRTLFFSAYVRNDSFFSNSIYAAQGLPDAAELTLLEPFRSDLPDEVFTQPLIPPTTDPPGSLRTNLQQARDLLEKAGWTIRDGVLVNAQGERFRFDILLAGPTFERVIAPYVANLKRLGIAVDYRTIDPALYADRIKDFDFDMVVTVFGQSQSPGNEQRDYWTSMAADRQGSRNLAGIADPAVDALVDAIVYAETQEELVTACRALDRVLWHGYYVVPNWYLAEHRLAYAARLRHPDTLPLYYHHEQWLDTWWQED